ncbi:MAG: hypothetical protein ACTS44_00700 [Candidatus Hodgkinia cicadicola]
MKQKGLTSVGGTNTEVVLFERLRNIPKEVKSVRKINVLMNEGKLILEHFRLNKTRWIWSFQTIEVNYFEVKMLHIGDNRK